MYTRLSESDVTGGTNSNGIDNVTSNLDSINLKDLRKESLDKMMSEIVTTNGSISKVNFILSGSIKSLTISMSHKRETMNKTIDLGDLIICPTCKKATCSIDFNKTYFKNTTVYTSDQRIMIELANNKISFSGHGTYKATFDGKQFLLIRTGDCNKHNKIKNFFKKLFSQINRG